MCASQLQIILIHDYSAKIDINETNIKTNDQIRVVSHTILVISVSSYVINLFYYNVSLSFYNIQFIIINSVNLTYDM